MKTDDMVYKSDAFIVAEPSADGLITQLRVQGSFEEIGCLLSMVFVQFIQTFGREEAAKLIDTAFRLSLENMANPNFIDMDKPQGQA